MSFFPKSLPDLGFEVCTCVNPLRKKVFSCCSNSLMGVPPVLGDPSKYSRISANTAHNRRSEQGNLCGLTNLWYQLGSGASSLSPLKLGHTHSVLRHFAQVSFHSSWKLHLTRLPQPQQAAFQIHSVHPSIRRGKGMAPFQSGPANSKWKLQGLLQWF